MWSIQKFDVSIPTVILQLPTPAKYKINLSWINGSIITTPAIKNPRWRTDGRCMERPIVHHLAIFRGYRSYRLQRYAIFGYGFSLVKCKNLLDRRARA